MHAAKHMYTGGVRPAAPSNVRTYCSSLTRWETKKGFRVCGLPQCFVEAVEVIAL